MPKNIEIKASIQSLQLSMDTARSLSKKIPEIIRQEDYFFYCSNGRLKLRIFSSQRGVLIFYTRNNEIGPKMSEYSISETTEPGHLLKILEKAYGISGTVKKIRTLFMVGRTRIHIDQVENLGSFIEFEVVLSENEDIHQGKTEASHLMEVFKIKEEDLIDCAYVDLINQVP